jgi:ABC-type oligopeptide transport system ATPase subunit
MSDIAPDPEVPAGGVVGDPTIADTSVAAVRRDTLGEGDNILQVRELRKEFPIMKGLFVKRKVDAVRAVNGVSFDVRRGETFGLVGESGCGKSTTARMICRLLDPTGGRIDFDGTDIAGMSRKALVPFRRDVQMVFQDPYSSLNPRQTIGSIIGAPLDIHGLATGEGERKRKVQELMDLVGLNPEHYNRLPHEFSGGQRQRIGIARAIALSPKLLIADEPVSALDVSIQAQILNLLRQLQRDLGLSLLFIAHDLSVVRYMCDRMAVMYAGEIVELATSDELYANPAHPYTRALLDAVPTPDPDARARRLAERERHPVGAAAASSPGGPGTDAAGPGTTPQG